MGNIDSQSAPVGASKFTYAHVELLRLGYDGAHCADVLSEP